MFYPAGGPLGSDSSWGMFALTGNPAYYLLYRSLIDEEVGGDGMTEEERERR